MKPNRHQFWINLCLLLAGAAQALSFAPQNAWWLQILAMAVFAFWLRRQSSIGAAAWGGWFFALGWFVAGLWWIFISMDRYTPIPRWVSAPALLGLMAFMASFYAASSAFFVWLRARRNLRGLAALLFAACWLAPELLRTVLFTGFPWLAIGYAHTDGPLARYASLVGVYGIGFLAAWVAALLAAFVQTLIAYPRLGLPRWLFGLIMPALLLALILLLPLATPNFWTQSAGKLRVTLLQGNVPQEQKFTRERMDASNAWYWRAIDQSSGDLVITPETAFVLAPEDLTPGYWESLMAVLRSKNQSALLGAPLHYGSDGYTNSALGINGKGERAYRYDKHHLVPFGEFIPFGFAWFVEMMRMPLGEFSSGPLHAASFAVQRQRLAPQICFEDLYGNELAARFADAASAPTLLVNMSNIAWFGDSIAMDQHLQIARMRALEFERGIMRATNTGPTALIDHHGRIIALLPREKAATLTGDMDGREGLTPFARWAAVAGLWPYLALFSLIWLVALLLRARH